MEHLIVGIRDAVAKECWYPALTAALALPDTCATITQPGRRNSGARYIRWIGTYFERYVTPDARAFLTGRELYDLRCRFVHEGELRLSDDEPQHPNTAEAMFEVLNEVLLFVCETDLVPARGMGQSTTGRRTTYTVAVKDLCEWICRAADDWLQDARRDPTVAARLERLPRIMRLHLDGRRTPV
jgi:hypothetical protein